MPGRRSLAVLACGFACAAAASAAHAASGLIVGVADDYLKSEPARAGAAIRDIGFSAVRLSLDWAPGQAEIGGAERAALSQAFSAAGGLRVVVVAYSRTSTPLMDADREQYCSFLRSVVLTFPVNDVIVWNEVNKSTFWRPQFTADGSSAAPRDYARLLARCYEVLHAAKPGVNVIHAGLSSTGNDRPTADSNISHSPGNFIRKEGEALRGELAGKRLYDTFGLHPYGEDSAEPPWKRHDASATIAIGDWSKLMQALRDAFRGTAQPYPGGGTARTATGAGSTDTWYLEIGFQSTTEGGPSGSYSGSETDLGALPPGSGPARALSLAGGGPVTQASQLVDAIRRAYCQPYIGAYFNFLLLDERDLGRWQSAPLWADWTAKPSAAALREVIAEVRDRRVDCANLAGGPAETEFQERIGVTVRRVQWPKTSSFNWKHDLWRFRIQTEEAATYTASVVRISRRGRVTASADATVLRTSGELKKLYFSIVKFPRKRLAAGRYRMEIRLTSAESSERRSVLRGPVFSVKPRRS
jgi:hypothetical protein